MQYYLKKNNKENIFQFKYTQESVDLATHFSKAPWATKEEVVDAFGEESEHQQEVRDSQVHHQQVGRSAESREAAEDLEDDGVSSNGTGADNQVHQTQKVIPSRVQSLVGVPVRVKEAADILRSVGIESEGIGQSPRIESLLLGHSHHSITSQIRHLIKLEKYMRSIIELKVVG